MNLRGIKLFNLFILVLFIGIAFGLSVYYTTQSFVGLQEALISWLKSLINEQDENLTALLMQISSITLFATSSFIFFILFSTGLSMMFLNKTEHYYRAVMWQFHKYFHSFLPFVLTLIAGITIITLSVVYFNSIMTVSGVNLGLVVLITTFAGLNILLFLVISGIFSIYKLLKYNFGTEIAVSKPELENRAIAQKSANYPAKFMLFTAYLLFIVFLGLQFTKVNETTLLPFLFLNIFSYTGIKYLKTSAYKNSHV